MGTTMVRMENVRKNFGDLEVLKDISFELKQGEVVAVIGPSGSGKSTLLRCLNRLETIDGGSIAIEGEYLVRDAKYVEEAEARRICGKMGMVFQQFNLFPHMTVLDNLLEAPMIVKKMARADILPIAEELLRKIGLEEKRDVYPTKLSGGQQQRVAIARALASKPAIILADEPTGNLDSKTSQDVIGLIKISSEKLKQTIVMITHDEKIAQLADRRLRIEDGVIVSGGADYVQGKK